MRDSYPSHVNPVGMGMKIRNIIGMDGNGNGLGGNGNVLL
jgi:hypothetical protein